MAVLRTLARLIGFLWMLLLALFGLGVALYCFDGLVSLGSARPDRLLHLPSVRRHVGRFLNQVAAPGSTAGLALLFVPISTVAYATLPRSMNGDAAALFSMSRNVFGSVGISLATAASPSAPRSSARRSMTGIVGTVMLVLRP